MLKSGQNAVANKAYAVMEWWPRLRPGAGLAAPSGEEDGEGWAYCKRDPEVLQMCVAQASDECAFAKDGDVISDFNNYTEHKLGGATSRGDCAKQVRCYSADAQGATYDPVSGDCYAEFGVNHIRDNNQGEAYEGCLFTAPAAEEPSAPSTPAGTCGLVARCENCAFSTSNYFEISQGTTAVACRAACLADGTCGGVLVGKDSPDKNRKGRCYGYRLHAQSTAGVDDDAGYDAWTKSCPTPSAPDATTTTATSTTTTTTTNAPATTISPCRSKCSARGNRWRRTKPQK